uniref:Uncharacterized protein n=1 Tax=Anguilla anguilla TaxID=7936 RepID=A0A0E9VMY1_ANGAN
MRSLQARWGSAPTV